VKILYLTSRFPYPPFRGDKLHLYNILKPLSRRHEVTLVSFIQRGTQVQWVDALRPLCHRIELVHLPAWRSLVQCLQVIFSKCPFQVAYFKSRAMNDLVHRVIAEEQPDVVHVHLIRMAQFVEADRKVPRVVDLTDATSLYLSRFRAASRSWLKKLLLSEELRRILDYEKVLAEFDLSLVCSPLDLSVMKDHVPRATLEIVRNAVDMSRFPPLDGAIRADPGRIIFTGNMTYFPNEDAARYMVNDILPLIRREIPDVRLFLVGQNPPASVRALAGAGVVVTGFVEDIRAEYARSAVAVAPIRFGAGTLYKILEPLALGIPVVTTSTGIGGVDLIAGEDILVGDDPQAFATHVVRLLRDPDLQRMMAARAAAKVLALHDWEIVAGKVEGVYRDVVNAHRGKNAMGST
jgi:sugar transferase (PEP-CTERM/EpsH1 system associated)